MKRIRMIIIGTIMFSSLMGQTISPELISLSNFIRRMHEAEPFEGVKVVEDYHDTYMISLVMLEKSKYKSELVMNKVAAAKARSNVNKFLNGVRLTTDFYVQTEEKQADTTVTTEIYTYDVIRERSQGIVDAMKVLTTFYTNDNNYYVYVMFKKYATE